MNPPFGSGVLSIRDAKLYRGSAEHRILAGAIHYFRVHPDLWADRLARLAAMGANTVDTYIAWNFHQPKPDVAPDFTGWRDVARFITLAGQAGLDVIVRPGPYICAEWDNGGFPSWAIKDPAIALRSSDPRFTAPVETWFDTLLAQLVPLQAAHGGPIVAMQVENEYGSYGDDQEYLAWNRRALEERGVTEILFTADGGTNYYLDGGAMPGTWATATLGSRGDEAIEIWRERRPHEPFLNVEFWNGWFDHWSEHHHTRPASEVAAEAKKMLDLDGSICLYMAHGGTNFGLWSGSNHDKVLQPTVTSYDSDAPIAEDGSLTEKFFAMRELFLATSRAELGELPVHLAAPVRVLPAAQLTVATGTDLLAFARSHPARGSVRPRTFDELDQDQGMVFYTANPFLGHGEQTVRILGLADRAYLWLDGVFIGALDDSTAEAGLAVTGAGANARLDILVENLGRINYGPLFGQGKGILTGVLIGQRYIFHWEQRCIPLTDLDEEALARHAQTGPAAGSCAGFAAAELDVAEPADTYVALPGFGKGFLWVNGFLVGRYWEIGPQVTLYVPAPLLRAGKNTFTVLELEHLGQQMDIRTQPDLGSAQTPEA
ncbi:MAG: beta-galactosidase [Acidobacteria bacterium]|nr:beta-galactosidase [Acidobacteriota bacterium]